MLHFQVGKNMYTGLVLYSKNGRGGEKASLNALDKL